MQDMSTKSNAMLGLVSKNCRLDKWHIQTALKVTQCLFSNTVKRRKINMDYKTLTPIRTHDWSAVC